MNDPFMGCPKLERAIKTYYYTCAIDGDVFGIINALKLAITENENLLLPAVLDEDNSRANSMGLSSEGFTLKIPDGPYATVQIIQEEKKLVFPVFTSMEEMKKAWEGDIIAVPFQSLYKLVSSIENCEYILFNSNGQALPVTVDRLREIVEEYEPRNRAPIIRTVITDLPCDAIVYIAKITENGVEIPGRIINALKDNGEKLDEALESEEYDYIMMFPAKGIGAENVIIALEDEYEDISETHQALCNCYCWTLSFAKEKGLRCISFDAFPDQYMELQPEETATIALTGITGWEAGEQYIMTAYICCRNEEEEAEYLKLLSDNQE